MSKATQARLYERYVQEIRPELQKKLAIKNIMEVPKLNKIVLNVGVKEAVGDSKVLANVMSVLETISGQRPVPTKARKSIAGFKLREGMKIGAKVTLRGQKMYEFLDRMISLAMPKIRDFRGVQRKLDGRGNYNLGIKESTIFPEMDYGTGERVHGLNVTIDTSTTNDAHAFALLESFGMPFIKD